MNHNIQVLYFMCMISNLLFYFTLDDTYFKLLIGNNMNDTQKYELLLSICLMVQIFIFSGFFKDIIRQILVMNVNNVAILPVIYQIFMINIIIGLINGLRYANIYVSIGAYAIILSRLVLT